MRSPASVITCIEGIHTESQFKRGFKPSLCSDDALREKEDMTDLYVSCPSIKVQMQVLDLSEFTEFILNIFFGRFFMHACYDHDPSFDGCRQEHDAV